MTDAASRAELGRRFAGALSSGVRRLSARVRGDLARHGDLRVLWFAKDPACFELIRHTAKHAPVQGIVWAFASEKETALRLVREMRPDVLCVSSGEEGGHEILKAAREDPRCPGLRAVNTYWGACALRPPFDHRLPTWDRWDGGFLDYMGAIRTLFQQIRADRAAGAPRPEGGTP